MQISQAIPHLFDEESIFDRKSQSILIDTHNNIHEKKKKGGGGGGFFFCNVMHYKKRKKN